MLYYIMVWITLCYALHALHACFIYNVAPLAAAPGAVGVAAGPWDPTRTPKIDIVIDSVLAALKFFHAKNFLRSKFFRLKNFLALSIMLPRTTQSAYGGACGGFALGPCYMRMPVPVMNQ